jgi:hypothetical protein
MELLLLRWDAGENGGSADTAADGDPARIRLDLLRIGD